VVKYIANNNSIIIGFLLGAHHGMKIEDVDYVTDKIKTMFEIIVIFQLI